MPVTPPNLQVSLIDYLENRSQVTASVTLPSTATVTGGCLSGQECGHKALMLYQLMSKILDTSQPEHQETSQNKHISSMKE